MSIPRDGREPTTAAASVAAPRARLLRSIGVAVLAFDVLTKVLVVATLSDREPLRLLGGALYLTEARNTGAAFSFATGATEVFTVIALVVVVLLVWGARRVGSAGWAVSLGLILGGAAGNLIDRLLRDPGVFRGAVIDFLSLFDPYGQVWPIFNLADSAIVCGGVLAVVLSVRGREIDGASSGSSSGSSTGVE